MEVIKVNIRNDQDKKHFSKHLKQLFEKTNIKNYLVFVNEEEILKEYSKASSLSLKDILRISQNTAEVTVANFLCAILQRINHKLLLFDEMSIKESAEYMEPFSNVKFTGLSIDWNDIMKIFKNATHDEKAYILAHSMTFDFLDNVNYKSFMEQMLNSPHISLSAKSELLSMAIFARADDDIKNMYKSFLETSTSIQKPLLYSFFSNITKSWLKEIIQETCFDSPDAVKIFKCEPIKLRSKTTEKEFFDAVKLLCNSSECEATYKSLNEAYILLFENTNNYFEDL